MALGSVPGRSLPGKKKVEVWEGPSEFLAPLPRLCEQMCAMWASSGSSSVLYGIRILRPSVSFCKGHPCHPVTCIGLASQVAAVTNTTVPVFSFSFPGSYSEDTRENGGGPPEASSLTTSAALWGQ